MRPPPGTGKVQPGQGPSLLSVYKAPGSEQGQWSDWGREPRERERPGWVLPTAAAWASRVCTCREPSMCSPEAPLGVHRATGLSQSHPPTVPGQER